MDIGKQIKIYRLRANLTQERLAEAVRVTPPIAARCSGVLCAMTHRYRIVLKATVCCPISLAVIRSHKSYKYITSRILKRVRLIW